MARILAPHGLQEGYAYIRAMRYGHDEHGRQLYLVENEPYEDGGAYVGGLGSFAYHDGAQDARTISSRRVEEAVETADYLKRCEDERLAALRLDGVWHVGGWYRGMYTGPERGWSVGAPTQQPLAAPGSGSGPTLREAYYRFHAKAEGESS